MGIIKFLKNLTKDKPNTINTLAELELKVLKAKEDWHTAQKICDEITDPTYLDSAILKTIRAERRYMHYLKLIKESTSSGAATKKAVPTPKDSGTA